VRECVDLTPYAFQTRYPGDYEPVTEDDYRRAMKQAGAVLDWAAKSIGTEARTKPVSNAKKAQTSRDETTT
jgi:hypothetical protein